MTKEDVLAAIFTKYNLVFDPSNPNSKDNDVFIHKHYKIITRTGIQKIERASKTKCKIEIVASGPDYCNVTGTGQLQDGPVLNEYTTLASANSENCSNAYYVEMAEKRCRSRLILTLVGLYELGVFGEEESEAFKKDDNIKTAAYRGK